MIWGRDYGPGTLAGYVEIRNMRIRNWDRNSYDVRLPTVVYTLTSDMTLICLQ